MLIDNDFLDSKDFTIDINNRKVSIVSCDVIIDLTIRQRDSYVRRNIHVFKSTVIFLEAKLKIAINFSISIDTDFLFESIRRANFTLFYYIVNVYFSEILIRNDFDVVKIFKNFCLESVIELTYNDCFQITQFETHRAVTFSKYEITRVIEITTMFIFLVIVQETIKHDVLFSHRFESSKMKNKLSNDIVTYDDEFFIANYISLIRRIFESLTR